MTTRATPNCTPEAVAKRARATYTRAEIVYHAGHYTAFYAVYTTPEGEVADRVYCYSDMIAEPRQPPGYRPARVAWMQDAETARVREWLRKR